MNYLIQIEDKETSFCVYVQKDDLPEPPILILTDDFKKAAKYEFDSASALVAKLRHRRGDFLTFRIMEDRGSCLVTRQDDGSVTEGSRFDTVNIRRLVRDLKSDKRATQSTDQDGTGR